MVQGNIGGFHEHDANSVIAEWLNDAGRKWEASAERTGSTSLNSLVAAIRVLWTPATK